MICSNCGADNKPDSKFCEKCGTVLGFIGESASDIKPMGQPEQKKVVITDVQNEVKPQVSPMPGSPMPGSPMPGSPMPGSPMPGSPMPGAPVQGGPVPVMPVNQEPPMPESLAATVPEKAETEKTEQAHDASDDSTTVLTGELRTPVGGAMGFGNAEAPKFQNQEEQPVQPGAAQQPPVQPPVQPPKQEKQPKKKKEKDPNKKKCPVGAVVYIIISAVAIFILVIALAAVFLISNKKIKDLKNSLDFADLNLEQQVEYYETELDNKNSEIDSLNGQIDDLNDKVAMCEEDIAKYQQTNDSYTTYDSLIKFADETSTGQGYADFFVSDTVIHLSGNEEVAVQVYFRDITENDSVEYLTNDKNIAACEWGTEWTEHNVATLYISSGGTKGNTIVTISNSVNDEKIEIYVYAD